MFPSIAVSSWKKENFLGSSLCPPSSFVNRSACQTGKQSRKHDGDLSKLCVLILPQISDDMLHNLCCKFSKCPLYECTKWACSINRWMEIHVRVKQRLSIWEKPFFFSSSSVFLLVTETSVVIWGHEFMLWSLIYLWMIIKSADGLFCIMEFAPLRSVALSQNAHLSNKKQT